MARNPKTTKKTPSRKPRHAEGKGRVRRGRPKVCRFCAEHSDWVDYKDVNLLRRFMNDRGRIKSRGATGTCAQHQRDVAVAIKTARELALLPYVVRAMAADTGDRRPGRRGPDRVPGSGEAAPSDVGGAGSDTDDADAIDPESVDDTAEESETSVASDSPHSAGNQPLVASP